jgi:hypothetical protein
MCKTGADPNRGKAFPGETPVEKPKEEEVPTYTSSAPVEAPPPPVPASVQCGEMVTRETCHLEKACVFSNGVCHKDCPLIRNEDECDASGECDWDMGECSKKAIDFEGGKKSRDEEEPQEEGGKKSRDEEEPKEEGGKTVSYSSGGSSEEPLCTTFLSKATCPVSRCDFSPKGSGCHEACTQKNTEDDCEDICGCEWNDGACGLASAMEETPVEVSIKVTTGKVKGAATSDSPKFKITGDEGSQMTGTLNTAPNGLTATTTFAMPNPQFIDGLELEHSGSDNFFFTSVRVIFDGKEVEYGPTGIWLDDGDNNRQVKLVPKEDLSTIHLKFTTGTSTYASGSTGGFTCTPNVDCPRINVVGTKNALVHPLNGPFKSGHTFKMSFKMADPGQNTGTEIQKMVLAGGSGAWYFDDAQIKVDSSAYYKMGPVKQWLRPGKSVTLERYTHVLSSAIGTLKYQDNTDIDVSCGAGYKAASCSCVSPWTINVCNGASHFAAADGECYWSIPRSGGRRRNTQSGAGAMITALCQPVDRPIAGPETTHHGEYCSGDDCHSTVSCPSGSTPMSCKTSPANSGDGAFFNEDLVCTAQGSSNRKKVRAEVKCVTQGADWVYTAPVAAEEAPAARRLLSMVAVGSGSGAAPAENQKDADLEKVVEEEEANGALPAPPDTIQKVVGPMYTTVGGDKVPTEAKIISEDNKLIRAERAAEQAEVKTEAYQSASLHKLMNEAEKVTDAELDAGRVAGQRKEELAAARQYSSATQEVVEHMSEARKHQYTSGTKVMKEMMKEMRTSKGSKHESPSCKKKAVFVTARCIKDEPVQKQLNKIKAKIVKTHNKHLAAAKKKTAEWRKKAAKSAKEAAKLATMEAKAAKDLAEHIADQPELMADELNMVQTTKKAKKAGKKCHKAMHTAYHSCRAKMNAVYKKCALMFKVHLPTPQKSSSPASPKDDGSRRRRKDDEGRRRRKDDEGRRRRKDDEGRRRRKNMLSEDEAKEEMDEMAATGALETADPMQFGETAAPKVQKHMDTMEEVARNPFLVDAHGNPLISAKKAEPESTPDVDMEDDSMEDSDLSDERSNLYNGDYETHTSKWRGLFDDDDDEDLFQEANAALKEMDFPPAF